MSGYRLIEKLTTKGNVVIGAGCYSAALQTADNSIVAKVGTTLRDPWLDYYDEIISIDKKNKYVPQVYEIHVNNSMDYYLCKMEKLDEQANSATRRKQHYDLCFLIEQFAMSLIDEDKYYREIAQFTAVSDPNQLLQLLNKIKDRCPEDTRIDLHSNNIMYRNDEIVILDPWCEEDIDDTQNVEEWLDWDACLEGDNLAW